jgi:hypothetical protein
LESEEYEKAYSHTIRRIGFTSKPGDVSGCVDRVVEEVGNGTVTRIMCNKADIPEFGLAAIQVTVYYTTDAPKTEKTWYSSLLKVEAM